MSPAAHLLLNLLEHILGPSEQSISFSSQFSISSRQSAVKKARPLIHWELLLPLIHLLLPWSSIETAIYYLSPAFTSRPLTNIVWNLAENWYTTSQHTKFPEQEERIIILSKPQPHDKAHKFEDKEHIYSEVESSFFRVQEFVVKTICKTSYSFILILLTHF